MAVILPQGVLKRILLLIETLSPFGTFLGSEDPALHVLSFKDKDSVRRNNDVIDLCRPVRSIYDDIVEPFIGALIKR